MSNRLNLPKKRINRKRCAPPKLLLSAFPLLLLLSLEGAAQQSVPVRVNRWLEVRQMNGAVTYQQSNSSRAAKRGDRLQAVGEGITTGPRASTTLEVDTGIGFVNVSENTQVIVGILEFAADNGRITHLIVPRGQVRLQLRRFTHRGSRLQIRTPAGVSAVRGTEFGVGVQPNGKTGVATLTGAVTTVAQGRTVAVPAGFQNFTIPGEVPSAAVPLKNNTDLQYSLRQEIQAGIRRLRLDGQVDPVNTVFIGKTPQSTDRNGRFSVVLPAIFVQKLEVTVITPLGRQQVHPLTIRL